MSIPSSRKLTLSIIGIVCSALLVLVLTPVLSRVFGDSKLVSPGLALGFAVILTCSLGVIWMGSGRAASWLTGYGFGTLLCLAAVANFIVIGQDRAIPTMDMCLGIALL